MKIAINTRFLLSNKLEGIGWFTHEVARRWVEWHTDVEFTFIFDRPFSDEFIPHPRVKPVVAFPPARHPFLFYGYFEWAIPRILRREQADIFVSPDGFLSLRTHTPTLMVMHDVAYRHFDTHVNWIQQRYYDYFVPRFMARADRIATVSEYSKQDFIQQFGTPSDKIDVVYNGCNDNFRPLPDDEKARIRQQYAQGCPYWIYVGSIHPRKNVARLIEAFDQFKSRVATPHKLVLAGRMAWQTGEVGEVMQRIRHKDDIIFLGYVSADELPRVVASAFAVAYVSLFEGFGIPLLEAMQCDVPAIASDTSSMPEVIGDAGLLVNPYSVESIANAMVQLAQDSTLYDTCIRNGQAQRQKFSWDKTAAALWQSVEQLRMNNE